MAHTKAGSSTKLGRDSIAKRLGVKINQGEHAGPGEIIVRQRGTHYLPGRNVRRGGDDTLYAAKAGVVQFAPVSKIRWDGRRRAAKIVTVQPAPER